jgi:bifunctional DNA-binding transcriptional regulator/antitoxin component of YhaV-PrlF toxin-antitoxin module
MSTAIVDSAGSVVLPAELRQRYHLDSCTAIRVVETRHGLLLVPLTNEPMPPALVREQDEWRSLDAAGWDAFPYEEPQ